MTRTRRVMTARRFCFELVGLGTLECKGVSSVWYFHSGYLHHGEFLGVAHWAKRLEFFVVCLGIVWTGFGKMGEMPGEAKVNGTLQDLI